MTHTHSFDLLEEQWIACENLKGKREVLGIRHVLARAHELSAVSDESPLVTAATYRMLLAIVDQAYRPARRADWLALWKATTLPPAPLAAYFEKWQDRFDLFHPIRPFLQVAGLEDALRKAKGKDPERISAWRFVMETSTYSSHVHLLEPEPRNAALSPSQAARALLSFMAFASSGRIQNEAESWSGGNVRGGAAIVVQGRTLRETLVLNSVARDNRHNDDVPPWQRERNVARMERPAVGPTDVLVWPARCVQLFPEAEDGRVVVRQTLSAAGEWMRSESPDPQMAYYERNPKNPPVAMRFDPDRAVWRDSTALFDAATGKDAFRRPAAIDQLHALLQDGVLPKRSRFGFSLFGLSSNQAAIRFTRTETLPLPAGVLVDPDRLRVLKSGLTLADDLGVGVDRKVLFVLCERFLAPGDRNADKSDIGNLKASLSVMPLYWSTLGDAFGRWLVEVGEADDPDDALASWKKTLRLTARATFDSACERLGVGARSLQAIALAQNTLTRLLGELFPEPKRDGNADISNEGAQPS